MLNTKLSNEACLEAPDHYIGAEIVLACKDDIPVLDQFKKRKCDSNNSPIVDANSNPVLVTRIYEL